MMFTPVLRRYFWVLMSGVMLAFCGNLEAINPPYGTGVLTITNQKTPRLYVLGSKPLVLDSQMVFKYDYTQTGFNGAIDPVTSSLTDRTTWVGGTIYVTIDPVKNGNVLDRLSCTPAQVAITTAYDVVNRQLTITAPNTVTYADIQSTLRTLSLSVLGQCTDTRNVRIWVEWVGYKFVNSRNGRLYSFVETVQDGTGTFTWLAAYNDVVATNRFQRNFGMLPYFASQGNASERAAIKALGVTDGWLGGRSIPASSVTDGQVNVLFNYASSDLSLDPAPGSVRWAWVAGPDVGVQLSLGGTAFNGRYIDWASGEPNLGGTGPRAFRTWSNGDGDGYRWADDPYNSGVTLQRYYIEYGGLSTDENVITVRVLGGNSFLFSSPY
jgi:hypothetical protein